jgi:hypothetical protein
LLCFPLSGPNSQSADFLRVDDFLFSGYAADGGGKIEQTLHPDSSPATGSAWLADAKAQLDLLIKRHEEIVLACQPGLNRSSNTTSADALRHGLGSLQSALWVASFPMDCGDLQDAQTQLSAVLDQIAACRTLLDSLAQTPPGAQHADNAESAEPALATLARNLEEMQSSCLAWSAEMAQPSLPTINRNAAGSDAAIAPNIALPAPVALLDATITAGPTRAPDQFLAFLDELSHTVEVPIVVQPEASPKSGQKH